MKGALAVSHSGLSICSLCMYEICPQIAFRACPTRATSPRGHVIAWKRVSKPTDNARFCRNLPVYKNLKLLRYSLSRQDLYPSAM